MSRYFTRPAKAFYVEDEVYGEAMLPAITVPDHVPTNTGLLDAHGDVIWRSPNPMGFGKGEDW